MRVVGQSQLCSFLEQLVNISIGISVALLAQMLIFPLYSIHVSFQTNLSISLWFTAVSLLRGYAVRRFFNFLHLRSFHMSQQDVEIECDILKETDEAMLIIVDGEELWIPFSQIKRVQRESHCDVVTMTAWIAEQKGIEV